MSQGQCQHTKDRHIGLLTTYTPFSILAIAYLFVLTVVCSSYCFIITTSLFPICLSIHKTSDGNSLYCINTASKP